MDQHLIEFEIWNADRAQVEQSLNSIDLNGLEMNTHIWHRDALEFVDEGNVIRGEVDVGDCMDDLWLITWILFKISREISGAVFRLRDQDGEFLLIEAALVLPRWVSPESMDGRVFIRNGQIHWISPDACQENPLSQPTVCSLLSTDESCAIHLAPEAVQENIRKKLEAVPALVSQQYHAAKCIIPRDIARILSQDSRWIAPAVEAFYLRDLISVRHCQRMASFPPATSVVTLVKFSRMLYSQLKAQKFGIPGPFSKVEQLNAIFSSRDGSLVKERRWADLGMKLACGFEILMNDSSNAIDAIESIESINLENYPFNSDQRWTARVRNLERRGYFQQEIEGSSLYNTLLQKAKHSYITQLKAQYKTKQAQLEQSFSFPPDWSIYRRKNARRELLSLIQKSRDQISDEQFDASLEKQGFWSDGVEDDESWMHVVPEELEKLLEERTGIRKSSKQPNEEPLDLKQMMENITKMVQTQSGYEGVEVEDDSEDQTEQESNRSDASDSDSFEFDSFDHESGGESIEQFKQYLHAMDAQLKEFQGRNQNEFEEFDDQKESAIIQNLLNSFSAQHGQMGPVSTMLGSMGMTLPGDLDEEDFDSDDENER